jgi:hypothetical protein
MRGHPARDVATEGQLKPMPSASTGTSAARLGSASDPLVLRSFGRVSPLPVLVRFRYNRLTFPPLKRLSHGLALVVAGSSAS